MGAWDVYEDRVNAAGTTRRGAQLRREQHHLTTSLQHQLSYQSVLIDDEYQNVAVIDTDNLDTKFIYSLPGDDIPHGGMVDWADNHWLITERDVHTEVYTRAKMLQCNFELHWIDTDGVIHSQWCIIEDGTKYLTGEFEDRQFIVTRGDSRIAMTIAKNEHTVKFNRQSRFLIDDPDDDHMIAYTLSKPLKLHNLFNGRGVYKFVLQEVDTTDFDNQELGIADYYKYYRTPVVDSIDPETNTDDRGRKVWL